MTYFKLVLGLDCGIDKSVCPYGYPDYCKICMSKKFDESNFIANIFELTEEDSEQKRKEMFYKYIWRKYQDILNIRHIIIMNYDGLPAFKMAVNDLPIDVSLLTAFIHANISFSSEELTFLDKIKKNKNFFEFEYKNFNILLNNGYICRMCLILEKKASDSLKELLIKFTEVFERTFEDKMQEFDELGDLDLLAPAREFIEKLFDLNLIYPQTLSDQIPPDNIDKFPLIQKAVYEICKDILKEQPYFFVSSILDKASTILGVFSEEEILWNIYQMMREHIIIKIDLKFQEDEEEIQKQEEEKRLQIIQNIFELKNVEEIILESFDMSLDEALKKIEIFTKKAEIAEKNFVYQEALNEYQKALTYAKEFNLESEIEKINGKISKLIRLNKKVEFNFALEQANKSEKKKDYIIALKYLFQVKDMLNSDPDLIDDKIDGKWVRRLEHKIEKIQNYLQ